MESQYGGFNDYDHAFDFQVSLIIFHSVNQKDTAYHIGSNCIQLSDDGTLRTSARTELAEYVNKSCELQMADCFIVYVCL